MATKAIGQHKYTFTLRSFRITDTRARHNDTDFVSIAVKVGHHAPLTVPTKSMGDVNNGTHEVNLSIANIDVQAESIVAFSYAIVNSGHDKNQIEQALQKHAADAASKGVSAGATALGGLVGGPLGAGLAFLGAEAGGWIKDQLLGILFPNCDGSVAAGDHVFTGAQLAHKTSGGKVLTVTDENKGTDSATGCGGNSHYFVTWSIAAQK